MPVAAPLPKRLRRGEHRPDDPPLWLAIVVHSLIGKARVPDQARDKLRFLGPIHPPFQRWEAWALGPFFIGLQRGEGTNA